MHGHTQPRQEKCWHEQGFKPGPSSIMEDALSTEIPHHAKRVVNFHELPYVLSHSVISDSDNMKENFPRTIN